MEVQVEWGEAGVRHLAPFADAVVVVDVLSFGTCVDVGVGRGVAVLPFGWKDGRAEGFARERKAMLAGRRGEDGPSLSPASLFALQRGERLVLPSPNGGALCVLAGAITRAPVFAACLRNAAAVGDCLQERFEQVLVVPAGERWPDGTLRPALEDALGAGAVVDALSLGASPEAEGVRATFRALRDRLPDILRGCTSGRELLERGFPEDVELAAELNVSAAVPQLMNGVFVDAVG